MKKEDVHRGTLVLVNRDYPLRVERERRLCQINTNYPEVVLEKEASVTLKKLLEEICGENEIALVSGYRSKKEQERIFRTECSGNLQGSRYCISGASRSKRRRRKSTVCFGLNGN